ncbi:MAG: 23S rRNA pseudouridine(955/2504/2580) synthase RluC [Gammaproteobacteria bacterium]|nr:23S rRNA pseudouridine(955/2504/2580) synthase RluC [Gammaproteobacteria bacterium]
MENFTPKAWRLAIHDEEAQQRLDNFLFRTLKGVPKGHVYRLLRTGQVRVNGRRAKPDYRLVSGDQVRIPPVRLAERPQPVQPGNRQRAALESAILYEDDQLLVVNKPAGMAVHGGSGVSFGVIETLRTSRPEQAVLELVHRLDRDTSGCLLVAKKRSALRMLHAAMREGRVEKRYLALLAGAWSGGERIVRLALEKNVLQSGERRVRVAAAGKRAETRFNPLQTFKNAALVEATILTGRTHQIRVHAAHLLHPVSGDDKYGDRQVNKEMRRIGLKRMFLHAFSLGFAHPGTGETLLISAPLDDNLEQVLANLRKTESLTGPAN